MQMLPITLTIAGAAALRSFFPGQSPSILEVNTSRATPVVRFETISANPNTPIATTTNPMPSPSSGMPNV